MASLAELRELLDRELPLPDESCPEDEYEARRAEVDQRRLSRGAEVGFGRLDVYIAGLPDWLFDTNQGRSRRAKR